MERCFVPHVMGRKIKETTTIEEHYEEKMCIYILLSKKVLEASHTIECLVCSTVTELKMAVLSLCSRQLSTVATQSLSSHTVVSVTVPSR